MLEDIMYDHRIFTIDVQLQLLNLLIFVVFDGFCKPFEASQQLLCIGSNQFVDLIQAQMAEKFGS